MTVQMSFLQMVEAVTQTLVGCDKEFGFMEAEAEGDRVGSGTYQMIQAQIYETLAKNGWSAQEFEDVFKVSAHPVDAFDMVRFL